MTITPLNIPDVLLFSPKVWRDARGFFFESFRQDTFAQAAGHAQPLVQDNHSRSQRGVLRGLHYQMPPHAQGKLVRVVEGEIFDVAVDLRQSHATFGKWVGQHLSADNALQLWIPPGFAHGFVTLSDHAQVLYKTTTYYAPQAECCIRWDDPTINIQWPKGITPQVSAKDEAGLAWEAAQKF